MYKMILVILAVGVIAILNGQEQLSTSQEQPKQPEKAILERLEKLEREMAQLKASHYPDLAAELLFNGNANGGRVYNAILDQDRFGVLNSAYFLDGNSAYIDFGDVYNQAFASHSYSFWIKPFSLNREQFLISKGSGGVSGMNISLLENGSIRANFGDLPYTSDFFISTQPLITQSNSWYHIAITIDRDNSLISLYINGVLQPTKTIVRRMNVEASESFSKTVNLTNTEKFIVGSIYHHGESKYKGFFHGVIDEIRIYNRILSIEQIETLAK